MKYVPDLSGRAVLSVLAVSVLSFGLVANAQITSGQVLIQGVHGSATYSLGGPALSLKENLVLPRGATIKSGADCTVDLVLQYNGTVLRLMPNSTLSLNKLNQEKAGEET